MLGQDGASILVCQEIGMAMDEVRAIRKLKVLFGSLKNGLNPKP